MAHQQIFRIAHHADDVGQVLLLPVAARRGRMADAGAFVDHGIEVLQRHLRIGRDAVPERILRLVGPRHVLAIVLVHGPQVDAVLIIERRARHRAAVEEGAVEVQAAVGILRVGLDQLRSHEAAIGRAMQDGALRLADPRDEELAGVVGVGSRHCDAVTFAPVA